ncbi:hypothetical protein GGP41_004335 [Bipolaris sorokiniana]|uniref:Nuclear pore assembly and biogenesis-domain-containing protein n=2 Tax=Cochliobolus sativus TaxID=45130 RepID=A0A8H5ZLX9_COCSA|nr:uncharacterized protein COCSADRAFT_39460 [Bipolaris sorokiniana ND90Pr]EMD61754.1 hypothetical protein COCSADRAFT_39460 [Bipolaris sorokiniana ND90Pr]KAF5851500.1 hypothetical protein GGP41_004335 [Bipolaris sorokiniana]
MDFIQDYAAFLPRLLPPSFADPALHIITTFLGFSRTLSTHLSPLLNKLITQPDVASIVALLFIFFISLKILDMMYRAVVFWINLAFRLAFWGGILVVGLWVWNRGPEGFVDDVSGLIEYWMGEYERYSGEVKMFQQQKEDQIRFKAGQQQKRKGWR